MAIPPLPVIGDWYREVESRAIFEVVAFDDEEDFIEIQYFDGTVEEMGIDDWDADWRQGALESAEPPEDWCGETSDADFDENELDLFE